MAQKKKTHLASRMLKELMYSKPSVHINSNKIQLSICKSITRHFHLNIKKCLSIGIFSSHLSKYDQESLFSSNLTDHLQDNVKSLLSD